MAFRHTNDLVKFRETSRFGLQFAISLMLGDLVVMVTIINMWLRLGNDCGHTNKVACCLGIRKEQRSDSLLTHLSIKCVTVIATIISNNFKVVLKKNTRG